jgi:F-box protein 18 (helicase)
MQAKNDTGAGEQNPGTAKEAASLKLTKEQVKIIGSEGNIRINAVAGSGKTTTIIEYARTRPPQSRILYLAFNKSVKIEASRKFAEKGLDNAKVETAHSLAYRHIVFRYGYRIRQHGYRTHEIAELLGLQGNGEKHAEYIIANHINKFTAYFCNSDRQKVQDLNYLDVVSDEKARGFVRTFYRAIEKGTRELLGKMNSGEIEVTHDFYLKKFQLESPQLGFDYILFDEGQDASPAMLDVFLKQKATRVIVGDTHQQIYGWRFAVNSLEKVDFTTYHLSASFRFGQQIADFAARVLDWKKHISEYQPLTITGKGKAQNSGTQATIARTNLGLLLRAIHYITETRNVGSIYFEGNINSYTYADEGASLYDVLNLSNGRHDMVRDKLVKSMGSLDELEEYIEKTEDMQLSMMLEIVKEYGNEIPGIIKKLKDKHAANEEKEKAEMIFSTVHRCKGLEYDTVHLVNDFITEGRLEKLKGEDKKEERQNISKWIEEINLLYVAVTRARSKIYIPEPILPKEFPPSPQIEVVKVFAGPEVANTRLPYKATLQQGTGKSKKSFLEKIRDEMEQREVNGWEGRKGSYKPWTVELDQELRELYLHGYVISDLAEHFGRTKGAILSRIKKLELE